MFRVISDLSSRLVIRTIGCVYYYDMFDNRLKDAFSIIYIYIYIYIYNYNFEFSLQNDASIPWPPSIQP